MSGILAVGAPTPSGTAAALVSPASQAAASNPASAAAPAVILDLSTSAQTTPSKSLGEVDPNKVANALSSIDATNGFISIYEHTDYAGVAAQFGQAAADAAKAIDLRAVEASEGNSSSQASSIGLPAQQPTSPGSIKCGATPAYMTVGDFSFTNGGSTYSVTHGADGTLVGTKDGQAWQTWQLMVPGTAADVSDAQVALSTLTSGNAHDGTAGALGSGGAVRKLDIAARRWSWGGLRHCRT